jgi:galactokinase
MAEFTDTDTTTLVAQASSLFKEKFGSDPQKAVFAPGRVNLIGEHTDYNDGFVLPFALPFKTVVVGSRAASAESTVFSITPENVLEHKFVISRMVKGEPVWANYIKGAICQYLPDLPSDAAINIVLISNVPMGAGLSSSAALEVAVSTFLECLFNISSVTKVGKALRCQKAEHEWADTPCGIMDQYISAMGETGSFLLIDCRTKEYTLIPYRNDDGQQPLLIVTNSNVKHTLSGSEYPDRVRQCREAVSVLQKNNPEIKALRDATLEMIESARGDMDELCYKRAKHCISEDKRTLSAVKSLHGGLFAEVGKMMTESHISLRDDFQVLLCDITFIVLYSTTIQIF